MTTLVLSSSTLLFSLAHSRSSLSVNNGGRPFYREVPSVRPSVRLSVSQSFDAQGTRTQIGTSSCR